MCLNNVVNLWGWSKVENLANAKNEPHMTSSTWRAIISGNSFKCLNCIVQNIITKYSQTSSKTAKKLTVL